MDWSSLVTQIPVVAVFVWFTLEQQKRYQETMDKRETRYQESMDKRDARYLEVLDKISEKIENHDKRVDGLVSGAVDAVKGPRRSKGTAGSD